jgi:iron complex transport system permease protein
VLWPFLVGGLVLAAWLAGRMNLLALGDDVARGLGVRLSTTRIVTAVAVIVLAATATSLAGPIALLGLAVAHAARGLVGADYRWLTPLAGVLGAIVLVAADVIGRVVVAPAELEAGIVAAIVGAPVLIALVRRGRGASL